MSLQTKHITRKRSNGYCRMRNLHKLPYLKGWDRTKVFNCKGEESTDLAEEIYVDSCGRKGIGETPKCGSTRGLTSRPRKAKCISGAGYLHQSCSHFI